MRLLRRSEVDMQQKSRRQFVTASLAGLPMLAYRELGGAGRIRATSGMRFRTGRTHPGGSGVGPDRSPRFASWSPKAETKPASRKASARAIEATLGIQAAHIGLHYDAQVSTRSAAPSGACRPRGTDRRDGEVCARPQVVRRGDRTTRVRSSGTLAKSMLTSWALVQRASRRRLRRACASARRLARAPSDGVD